MGGVAAELAGMATGLDSHAVKGLSKDAMRATGGVLKSTLAVGGALGMRRMSRNAGPPLVASTGF